MNRDDYEALPPTMQLRVLTRIVLDGERLEDIDVGKRPLRPKFDMRIGRANGCYQWASETDAEGLLYWQRRAQASADKGGKYAAKDRKNAKELERWLAWRQWEPRTVWRGERFREPVVAAPPSDKPAVHQYERRQQSNDAPPIDDDEINYGDGGDDVTPYG